MSKEFEGNGLWKVTRSAGEIKATEARAKAFVERVLAKIGKCPICGEDAGFKIFGAKRRGVWVGCDKTEKCVRCIEWHSEGWSIDECADEWLRNNRGVRGIIRRLKIWWEWKYGKVAKREREVMRKRKEVEAAKVAERRRLFGVPEPKKRGRVRKAIDWVRGKVSWRKGKGESEKAAIREKPSEGRAEMRKR